MLNKIVRKSLFKTKVLLLSVFILFMLAITLLTTSLITYNDVQASYDAYQVESNFEDFRFYTTSALTNNYIELDLNDKYNAEFEKNFEEEFDVTLEKTYLTTVKEGEVAYGIAKYDENLTIDKVKLVDGELPTKVNEILLTPGVMERKNLQVGDKYTINKQTYKIAGSGYIPDYTFPVDIVSKSVSIGTDSFIPIYMNEASYNEISTESDFYYRGVFNGEKPEKTSEIFQKMTKTFYYDMPITNEYGEAFTNKEGEPITQEVTLVPLVMGADINPGIGSLQNSIDGNENMFKVLSIVIIIISLLITVVLFNSIFNSQKREIGIQKAEGISSKELGLGYLKYLSFIIILASVIGFLLGMQLKTTLVELLVLFYSVPLDKVQSNVMLNGIVTVMLVNILLIILVYLIAIRRNLKIEPLLLIKNIEKEKKIRFNFNFITARLNFVNKYKFNILVRTVGLSALLAFGVFASSFLLLMGGISYSIFAKLTTDTYQTTYTYDYKAIYSAGVTDPDYDQNSMISTTLTVKDMTNDMELTPANSSIMFIAYNFQDNDYINLSTNEQEPVDSNTIYITTVVKQLYHLKAGDVITVKNPYKLNQTMKIKVGGIIEDPMNAAIYMDLDKAHHVFDLKDDYANSEVGIGDKQAEVLAYDANAVYNKKADMEKNMQSMTQVLMFSISIIAFVAIIISFITLSMINSVVIKKNKKTISVMKVLGYTNQEISKMTTSAYKWILIVVYFLSIPVFEKIIQFIIAQAMADMDMSLTVHIGFKAIIFGILIILFVYYLSLFVAKRSINKISLAESLKADE